jgi:hypothetical protein
VKAKIDTRENLKLRFEVGDKVSVEGHGRAWNGFVTKQARTPISNKCQITPIDGGIVPVWVDEDDLRRVKDKFAEMYPDKVLA